MAKLVGQDKAYRAASEIIGRCGSDEAVCNEVARIQAAARTNAQHNQALLIKIAALSALEARKGMVRS